MIGALPHGRRDDVDLPDLSAAMDQAITDRFDEECWTADCFSNHQGGITLQGTQPTSAIDEPQRSSSLAADAVVVVHAGFIAFLLGGGFLTWWWPGAAAVHVLALVASSAIYLGGFDCPLTNLEKRLRVLAGEAVYEDGFIAHYLVRPVYAGGMTTALGLGLLALVVGTTLAAYGRHLA